MTSRKATRVFPWVVVCAAMIFQGCTMGASTGRSSETLGGNSGQVAGPARETVGVTLDEMTPFFGNWQGIWEEDLRDTSVSTTSETRRALLSVGMVSEKPMVTWALGAGIGGGTWHDARAHNPPSLGRYPAKFSRKDGTVVLEFTTRLGNRYRFLMKGDRLHGVNASAAYTVRCELMKSSQEGLFTDASLAQFEVGLN